MKCGGSLESIHFADLSGIYGSRTDREQWVPACRAAIDSPFSLGTKRISSPHRLRGGAVFTCLFGYPGTDSDRNISARGQASVA